jgi:hypothetical protein
MNLKKRLLITEDDRKYIKKLYGLIKEADEPEYDYSFEEKITFPAGYYSNKYMERDVLDSKLDDLITKIAKNKYVDDEGTQVLMGPEYQNLLQVVTSSGESQIPNKDNEKGGADLNPGDLGYFRSNTINNYVKKYITDRLGDIPNLQILTDIVDPIIGNTSAPDLNYYQGLVDCGLAKFKNLSKKGPCKQSTLDVKKVYDDEQFVKIFVGLKTTKNYKPIDMPIKRGQLSVPPGEFSPPNLTSCFTNMKIKIDYTKDLGYHKCNSAVYEVYVNGEKLMRDDGKSYASLNNNGLLDNAGFTFKKAGGGKKWIESNDPAGERFNTFVVSPELAKKLADKVSQDGTKPQESFNLELKCKNLAEFVKYDDLTKEGPLALNSDGYLAYKKMKWDGKLWDDQEWGFGCHGRKGKEGGVGSITIINGNGGEQKYKKFTPVGKDEMKSVLVADPCKGEQGIMLAKEK